MDAAVHECKLVAFSKLDKRVPTTELQPVLWLYSLKWTHNMIKQCTEL